MILVFDWTTTSPEADLSALDGADINLLLVEQALGHVVFVVSRGGGGQIGKLEMSRCPWFDVPVMMKNVRMRRASPGATARARRRSPQEWWLSAELLSIRHADGEGFVATAFAAYSLLEAGDHAAFDPELAAGAETKLRYRAGSDDLWTWLTAAPAGAQP
jgi:hypothetical protein